MTRMQKGLVLLVTHDPTLARTMTAELATLGFEVADAIDIGEATEQIERRVPQLVCVDLSLPRESGFEVCEYVRAAPGCVAVQILVLSERSTPIDIAAAEEAGANAFVRKPLDVRTLARYMGSMLERRPPSRSDFRALRPSDMPPSV
jgi:DNA-binding response OmpR family regulator